MLIAADVHGAVGPLRAVAGRGEPLLILGDLINFIDYRTMEGIFSEVVGREWVEKLVALRVAGRREELQEQWSELRRNRQDDLRQLSSDLIESAYREICSALEGAQAFVTYGNADRPDVLERLLPEGCRFIESGVVEIEGYRVGFMGGGVPSILGVPGEVPDEVMAERLAALGEVDILCTHVPPAVEPLQRDVIAGNQKGSEAILEYLLETRPRWHYFGDIHQPQATEWTVGQTRCRNVGYFRATGRAVSHPG